MPAPEAVAFIADARWVFAETMPDWPHEYTVKAWRVDERGLFEAFCRLLQTSGRVEPWPPPPATAIYRNRYLVIDGHKYWAMGAAGDTGPIADLTVINRTTIIDSDVSDRPGRVVAASAPDVEPSAT
jgi:hypothetical protein